jgi:hypothetical protein
MAVRPKDRETDGRRAAASMAAKARERIMLAISGFLEWFFVLLLVALVGATGLFALFVAAQLFRNPARRNPSRRP